MELIGGYGKGKCDRQEENEFAEFVDTVNCLHWRYELMVYACLRSLVREDVPCDGRVYLAFAKGELVSELAEITQCYRISQVFLVTCLR